MKTNTITREELIKILALERKVKLVAVLDSDFYVKEHIKGAISIPLLELKVKAEKLLNKDDIIIVYCGSFECPASTKAAKILMGLGFEKVYDYRGGIKDYKEAMLPLEGSLYEEDEVMEKIFFKGEPLTLVGRKIKIGDAAPDFEVVNSDFKEFSLANFKDKIKIITSFPSLDTPVCSLQVKAFNQAMQHFSDVVILGISKDLPFAQVRFCEANSIKNVSLFSDYKYGSFGLNYGLLIKENNLLARAVVILDGGNTIRYIQIVKELTSEPDYVEVMSSLVSIIGA